MVGMEHGENLAGIRYMETLSTMKRRMVVAMGWFLMALLLLPMGAMAQVTTHDVKIKVTTGRKNLVLQNATVTIMDVSGNEYTGTTNNNGEAIVTGVPKIDAGTVTVKAEYEYRRRNGKINIIKKTVTGLVEIDENGKANRTTIDLSSAASFTLEVVDAVTGEGIEGATVTVGKQSVDSKWGSVSLNLLASVGQKYQVAAKMIGYADSTVTRTMEEELSAGKISLKLLPGVIKLTPVSDVTVNVKNGVSNPVADVPVTIGVVCNEAEYNASQNTGSPDGQTTFKGVPVSDNGTVTVTADINGASTEVMVPVKVGRGSNSITIDLAKVKAVMVTVVDAVTKKGIEGATVKVGKQTKTTDSDGKVMLKNLLVDTELPYPVEAEAAGYANRTVMREVRNSSSNPTLGTIELTRVRDVKITVVNGKPPVEGATVTLVDGNGVAHNPETTEDDGGATVKQVPAPTNGTVTVEKDGKVVTVPVKVNKDGLPEPDTIDLAKIKSVMVTVVNALDNEWPIFEAKVTVGTQEVTTDIDGKAMLNLLGSTGTSYQVLAKCKSYADSTVMRTMKVDGSGSLFLDTIKLTRLAEVQVWLWKDKIGGTGVNGFKAMMVDVDGKQLTQTTNRHYMSFAGVPVLTAGTVTVKTTIDGNATEVMAPVKVINGPNSVIIILNDIKDVAVKVVDAESGNGINGATVTVGTQTATANNDDGEVTLKNLLGGRDVPYPMVAKANGYVDSTVMVLVNADGKAIPDVINLTKACKVLFDADGGWFKSGYDQRTVSVAKDKTIQEAQVEVPSKGDYAFKEWQLGGEKYDVKKTAVTKDITLKAVWAKPAAATFVVKGADNKPVAGATVTVTGAAGQKYTQTTGANGVARFEGLAAGTEYSYTVSKDGYTTGSGKVTPTADGLTVPVQLKKPKATLEFVVKGADNKPVAGAVVTVDGKSGTTDADGKAVIAGLEPKAHGYTVSKEGYEDAKGSVDLSSGDQEVAVQLEKTVVPPATAAATFVVKGADNKPVAGAVVTVDGKSGTTDADGKAVIAGLEQKAHGYTVSKEGYEDAKGSVDLSSGDQEVAVQLEKLKVLYLNVFVVDQDLKPIDGVVVKIFSNAGNPNTQETTKSEGWVKRQLPVGGYRIAVEKKGYNEPEPVDVTLEARGLDFTFVLQKEDQNNGSTTPVESELLAGVEMYPNPASVATVLHGVENAKRIAVYTVTGVQVLSQTVRGEKETNLQVESLAEGVYVVIVQTESGESKALKLVVRR